jgi:hypothetical protein
MAQPDSQSGFRRNWGPNFRYTLPACHNSNFPRLGATLSNPYSPFKSLFPEVLIPGDFKSFAPEVLILIRLKSFRMNLIEENSQLQRRFLEVLILVGLRRRFSEVLILQGLGAGNECCLATM